MERYNREQYLDQLITEPLYMDITDLLTLLIRTINTNDKYFFNFIIQNEVFINHIKTIDDISELTNKVYDYIDDVFYLRELTNIGFNFSPVYDKKLYQLLNYRIDFLKFFAENNYMITHQIYHILNDRRFQSNEHIEIYATWDNLVSFILEDSFTILHDDTIEFKKQIIRYNRKHKIKQLKSTTSSCK